MEQNKQFFENKIDYTDVGFILQNLSIINPSYDKDPTHLLSSRFELARHVCDQVVFCVYCLLSSLYHAQHLKQLCILVIGDGFIGNQVINKLVNLGCSKLLRIYCRAESNCENWKAKGLIAEQSIPALLHGVHRPDIVIANISFTSIPAIFRLILKYTNETTSFISTSFGFSRRKIFLSTKIPTVFKSFSEPQSTLSHFKNLPKESSNNGPPITKTASTTSSYLKPESLIKSKNVQGVNFDDELSASSAGMWMNDQSRSFDFILSTSRPISSLNDKFPCLTLARRTVDIKNFIYLVENYASLRGVNQRLARKIALVTVLGYNWATETFLDANQDDDGSSKRHTTNRKASVVSMEANAPNGAPVGTKLKMRTILEPILLNMLQCVVHRFQETFAQFITVHDLQSLTDDYHLILQEKEEAQQMKDNALMSELANGVILSKPQSPQNAGNGPQQQHHRKGTALYSREFLLQIYDKDADMTFYHGPGIDLIKRFNANDQSNNDDMSISSEVSLSWSRNSVELTTNDVLKVQSDEIIKTTLSSNERDDVKESKEGVIGLYKEYIQSHNHKVDRHDEKMKVSKA